MIIRANVKANTLLMRITLFKFEVNFSTKTISTINTKINVTQKPILIMNVNV